MTDHRALSAAGGVLLLHGFTGDPSTMRFVAAGATAAGLDVELLRLPGHGTVVDDLEPMRWKDWTAEVQAAHARLAARTAVVVVVGQSMGGSLALWSALHGTTSNGLVLINPVTRPQPADVRKMIDELLADGVVVAPGGRSDIADDTIDDRGYDGTPLAALASVLDDGIAPMTDRYAELSAPLLLFTSRQDHVVDPGDSVHLAATYGGEVEHRWLERSYHVATLDLERDEVVAGVVEFALRHTAAPLGSPR